MENDIKRLGKLSGEWEKEGSKTKKNEIGSTVARLMDAHCLQTVIEF